LAGYKTIGGANIDILSSKRAVIALGANLGDAQATLRDAMAAVQEISGLRLVRASRLYRSEPAHLEGQPEFVNAVMLVELDAGLDPYVLLAQLQAVERRFGRLRHEHWGPRTLDLDIIDIEGVRSDDELLRLPHLYALQRDFVVTPLQEVAPGYLFADGRRLKADDVVYGKVIGVESGEPDVRA